MGPHLGNGEIRIHDNVAHHLELGACLFDPAEVVWLESRLCQGCSHRVAAVEVHVGHCGRRLGALLGGRHAHGKQSKERKAGAYLGEGEFPGTVLRKERFRLAHAWFNRLGWKNQSITPTTTVPTEFMW